MKKTNIFIMLLIALLCFSSCQMADDPTKIPTYGDNTVNKGREGEYLVTVSRIRGIKDSAQSRGFDDDGEWEEGDDIVGVLLAFHDGKSTRKDANGFIKDDPYAFYIEELDYIGYNGDGMAYNYILYIPSVIQDVYFQGKGVNPYSGNPFWWYMKTYLNMSLPEIVDDYEDVIDFLLRNGKKLPYPKVEDVKGHWSADYSYLPIKTVFATSNYPAEANMSKIGFWYDEVNKVLYMPSSVHGEYRAGGGSFNDRDALEWYISTYMKEETKDFANPSEFIKSDSFKTIIESIDFTDPAYTPSGKDLKVEFTEMVDDELDDDTDKITFRHCSFYYAGMIRDEDGEPIKDNKIHVINDERGRDGNNGITVYFPEYLKDEYENERGKFTYNGDLFWWFIKKYHGVPSDTVRQYIDDGCNIPTAEMEKFITIPSKPANPGQKPVHDTIRVKNTYYLDNYPKGTMTEMGIYYDKAANTIYSPVAIYGEYTAAGMYGNTRSALNWYLMEYHDFKSIEEINALLKSENATERLKALDYEHNIPDGKIISEKPQIRVDDTFIGDLQEYILGNVSFYYPGRLLDADGKPIDDDKIHFETTTNGRIKIYMPESVQKEQLEDGNFSYGGDLFWNFIKKHHGVQWEEIQAIFNNDFKIPKEKLIEWMEISK